MAFDGRNQAPFGLSHSVVKRTLLPGLLLVTVVLLLPTSSHAGAAGGWDEVLKVVDTIKAEPDVNARFRPILGRDGARISGTPGKIGDPCASPARRERQYR
jgi:hypothetical protein